jgi:tRNA modification GTPase
MVSTLELADGDALTGGLNRDTIAAIATGPGAGGIGVVRLSGPQAHRIAEQITGKSLEPRIAHYRTFLDVDARTLDDGLALYFPGPRSFTGEDVVELQGHGGPLILQMLLERTLQLGARQARPGEFSERAFLNGRLDLAQAEAIADLISARTRSAARQAQASLRGVFSEAINALAQDLVALRIYVEAAIDFPEEDIDFLGDGEVAKRLTAVIQAAESLKKEARAGAMVRNGATIVLAGRPNAGKSSLLNRLAQDDVAIVTHIPGTTRDVVRQDIEVNGIPLRISDTAGLRETDDTVEQEGVRRATQEIRGADLLLHLIDDTDPRPVEALNEDVPTITVYNKIDLSGRPPGPATNEDAAAVAISTLTGSGMDDLLTAITDALGLQAGAETRFSARERHLTILDHTTASLKASEAAFLASGAGELLAEDLRLIHDQLGEITGRMTSDELLGEIFSSFCIGK